MPSAGPLSLDTHYASPKTQSSSTDLTIPAGWTRGRKLAEAGVFLGIISVICGVVLIAFLKMDLKSYLELGGGTIGGGIALAMGSAFYVDVTKNERIVRFLGTKEEMKAILSHLHDGEEVYYAGKEDKVAQRRYQVHFSTETGKVSLKRVSFETLAQRRVDSDVELLKNNILTTDDDGEDQFYQTLGTSQGNLKQNEFVTYKKKDQIYCVSLSPAGMLVEEEVTQENIQAVIGAKRQNPQMNDVSKRYFS